MTVSSKRKRKPKPERIVLLCSACHQAITCRRCECGRFPNILRTKNLWPQSYVRCKCGFTTAHTHGSDKAAAIQWNRGQLQKPGDLAEERK